MENKNNQQAQPGNDVALILQNTAEIMKQAPAVLTSNINTVSKAEAIGEDILRAWKEAWAITDENKRIIALTAVDERSNKFLQNCSAAVKRMNDSRVPITQIMDKVKKMFTENESKLDVTKDLTKPRYVKAERDKYAAEMLRIQKAKEEQIKKDQQVKNDAISISSYASTEILKALINAVSEKKIKMRNAFNIINLENYEKMSDKLKVMEVVPPSKTEIFGTDDSFASNIVRYPGFPSTISITNFEAKVEIVKKKIETHDMSEFIQNYVAEISAYKTELLRLLPSLKQELQEKREIEKQKELLAVDIDMQQKKDKAEANEMIEQWKEDGRKQEEADLERARLEEEEKELARQREQREQEEAERIKQEANEKIAAAAAAAEQQAHAEKTMTLFESAQAAAPVVAVSAKQYHEIKLVPGTKNIGILQIFNFWYEKHGCTLDETKLNNVKISQMISFCEKEFNKNGTRIESQYIKYVPVVESKVSK